MEISSNKLLPYSPAQQNASRAETKAPFNPRELEEQEKSSTQEYQPHQQDTQETAEAALDYRQLVLKARYQQAGGQQEETQQREAHRVGSEPLRVQQALGAYRDNAELQEGGSELMPRLDDYV